MDNNRIPLEIATEANIPLILTLIKDLAEYERLLDNVQATEDQLRHNLFGPRSFAEAIIAFQNDEPVAFAVYFFTFSTFLGLPGLYVEDIFVRPAFRRSGIGGNCSLSCPTGPGSRDVLALSCQSLTGTKTLFDSTQTWAQNRYRVGRFFAFQTRS